jgi:hypothetical protein
MKRHSLSRRKFLGRSLFALAAPTLAADRGLAFCNRSESPPKMLGWIKGALDGI